MTISRTNKSSAYILALIAIVAASISSVQAATIAAPGLSGGIKANMQVDLMSASTSGVNVDVGGDIRVYKGDPSTQRDADVQASSDVDFASEVQSDPNIAKIESDDDSVSLWYRVPAKLFGFIPMGMTVRTTVGAAGDVNVSHPWYYFLVKAEDAGAQTAAQSQVNATIGASGAGTEGEAKLTGATKAAFVKAIHSALKETVRANASAQADASASNK